MLSSLSNLVLGPPGDGRLRLQLVLVGLAIYVVFAGAQHIEVLLGFIDPRASAWLSSYTITGSLIFYLLVRSGWSSRFSSDPSLVFLQILHGVLAIVWSYAITGPARGAVLAILVLLLSFAMFGLSVRQSRQLALISFVGLTLVMAWGSQTDPERYPVLVELVHLAFSVVVLIGVSSLSRRMGELRDRLRAQRAALSESLARIRVLATQDELTGLVNRRLMTELMATEQSRMQRNGSAMCLALIDIDYFKRVNDTLGHQAGDEVLKAFAKAVTPGLRAADVFARWGGEEFLLLLPDTDLEEGRKCVERMRERLAKVSFDALASAMKVTFSAGLVSCRQGEFAQAAIERADAAMYRAKQAGRNCTVVDV